MNHWGDHDGQAGSLRCWPAPGSSPRSSTKQPGSTRPSSPRVRRRPRSVPTRVWSPVPKESWPGSSRSPATSPRSTVPGTWPTGTPPKPGWTTTPPPRSSGSRKPSTSTTPTSNKRSWKAACRGSRPASSHSVWTTCPSNSVPELLEQAETHLIDQAAQFRPRELRILVRKVFEVLAPDTWDDLERRALEAEERRAAVKIATRFRPNGDGSTRVTHTLPDAAAHRLRTYLEARTAPRHGRRTRSPRRRPALPPAPRTRLRRTPGEPPRRSPPDPRRHRHVGDHHHDAGRAPQWRARDPGQRRPHQPRRSQKTGVPGRDHPRRPRRTIRGPGPGPHPEAVQHPATQSHGHPRRPLPHRRLHRPSILVRSPPRRRILGPRRAHRPQRRRPALQPTPPPRPRPQIPDHPPTQRRLPIPPKNVSGMRRGADACGQRTLRTQ